VVMGQVQWCGNTYHG